MCGYFHFPGYRKYGLGKYGFGKCQMTIPLDKHVVQRNNVNKKTADCNWSRAAPWKVDISDCKTLWFQFANATNLTRKWLNTYYLERDNRIGFDKYF